MLIRRFGIWLVILVLILLIPTVLSNAFAAGNTMPGSVSAGEGSNTVSGFTISNIHYQLDTNDPSYLSNTNSVQFAISPNLSSSGSVKIQLTHSGTPLWYNCAASDGVNVTCNVPASTVTVQGISDIRIVAVQ